MFPTSRRLGYAARLGAMLGVVAAVLFGSLSMP
jgi:hypothetical protein